MPALPAAPNVLKVRTHFDYSNDTSASWRYYFLYSGTAPTSANLATMAATVLAATATDLASLASSNVTFTEVEVTDLSSATAGYGQATGSHVGTRSGANLPNSTCALHLMHIARRYRGGKPKVFLPFGTGGDLTNGVDWTSAFVSAVQTGIGSYLGAIEAAAPSGTTIANLVNVSYYHGFTLVTSPTTGRGRNVPTLRAAPVIDNVLSSSFPTRPSTQRRRNTYA